MGDKKPGITAILNKKSNGIGMKDAEGGDELGSGMGEMLMQELIEAIEAKDAAGAWSALKAAFLELDSEPHVEGEHLGE